YDVSSGKRLFSIQGNETVFSPDGALLAANGDGVYRTSDGQRLFDLPPNNAFSLPQFSPDNTLLAIPQDGVYDVATGQRLFTTPLSDYVFFSPDGKILIASGDGVYDVTTGQHLYDIAYGHPRFSSDGSLMLMGGVYELSSGRLLFARGDLFNPDET